MLTRLLSLLNFTRKPGIPYFETELAEAGLSFTHWYQQRQDAGRFYVDVDRETLNLLRVSASDLVTEAIEVADRVLKHQFNLLGSGLFSPNDPERPAKSSGYLPIDWFLDPVSGGRFPRSVPYKDWDLYAMRPGMADIKLPWELARCQHWVTLGQAYRLTGDPRYVREIQNELDDFMEVNPVGIGINWTCTMDVAIRALNWALGLELIRDAKEPSENFWERAYRSLFEHGKFIFNNLENNYEVTSNHFLSNVVGLYFLAVLFRELPAGATWEKFCRVALEEEIRKQVLDDGADFESSVPYHRLVTELFLGAARLADLQGKSFSRDYLNCLRKMVEFLLGVMRPDGLIPQIGDADDGRLHIFTGYGTWVPQDARHLLAPAALLLNEPSWLQHVGSGGVWEAAWWGYEIDPKAVGSDPPPTSVRLFPQAGLAVFREKGAYLLVSNGVVGTNGFGNHKHNDQLGFEYHIGNVPFFVDPGSYVYTSDPDARNLFRSSAYHNSLRIAGIEQNEMRSEWLFRLFETANPVHLDFVVTDEYVEYKGQHEGYRRLPNPVLHERRIRFLKESNVLLVVDRLTGVGRHEIAWHFHADPGVEIKLAQPSMYSLQNQEVSICLEVPKELDGKIQQAWFSPSYGVRRSCEAIELTVHVDIEDEASWLFVIGPENWFRENERTALMKSAIQEMMQSVKSL
jgi:uncharacterized heparinase superfamily protein